VVRAPDGTTGWASGDYLDFVVDREAVPTAPTPTPPPTPSPAPPPMDPALPLVLDPPAAPQGGSVVVRLRAPGAQQVVASLDPITVPLYPVDGERFAGVIPVAASRAPGKYAVQATAIDAGGAPASWSADLEVWPSHFSTETITLTETTMGLLDPVLRAEELAMLAGVWSAATEPRRWSSGWTVPVTGSVSSGFGGIRVYEPGGVPGTHTGLDLRGPRGGPVLAAAPGRVVLAQALTARGNAVVLDHGWGVYSMYIHMDSVGVAVGAEVSTGDVVGTLGATGMVTGPHLHFEVRVHGEAVDPRSWLRGVAVQIP
jgi:murein DD-endopeptidase MepM/ murein hydrolase activator NlpD